MNDLARMESYHADQILRSTLVLRRQILEDVGEAINVYGTENTAVDLLKRVTEIQSAVKALREIIEEADDWRD